MKIDEDKMMIPEPLPMPIRAVPASPMIVRTSAKSTLISPGLEWRRSEIGEKRRGEEVRYEKEGEDKN